MRVQVLCSGRRRPKSSRPSWSRPPTLPIPKRRLPWTSSLPSSGSRRFLAPSSFCDPGSERQLCMQVGEGAVQERKKERGQIALRSADAVGKEKVSTCSWRDSNTHLIRESVERLGLASFSMNQDRNQIAVLLRRPSSISAVARDGNERVDRDVGSFAVEGFHGFTVELDVSPVVSVHGLDGVSRVLQRRKRKPGRSALASGSRLETLKGRLAMEENTHSFLELFCNLDQRRSRGLGQEKDEILPVLRVPALSLGFRTGEVTSEGEDKFRSVTKKGRD